MEPNNNPEVSSIPPNAPIAPAQLPSATSLLSWAFKAYYNKFAIIFQLGSIIVVLSIAQTFAYLDSKYVVVANILGFLCFIFYYPSLVYAIASEKNLTFFEAITGGSKFAISFLFVYLLFLLVSFGGFSLLIIPGIALSIYLIFSFITVVTENKKGIDALLRSWFYTKGYWLAIAWRLFFFLVLSLLVTLVLLFAQGLSNFSADIMPNGYLVTNLLMSLLSYLVLTPLSLIYLYGIYHSIKKIKETSGETETPNKRRIIIQVLAIIGLLVFVAFIAFSEYRNFLGPI